MMLVRLGHNANAQSPSMLVTLVPIVTLVRLSHSSNVADSMVMTLLGIVTLVRPQDSNAALPMLVMLSGIMMLVRRTQNVKFPNAGDVGADCDIG